MSKFPTAISVPVTVLAGFLGAGKTTLLNRILHGDHGRRLAVLVNDFGEVNIDAQLVVGVAGETISLANGCICCSMRGELQEAILGLVRSDQPPEQIVIETSGVADPKSVVVTLMLSETLSSAIYLDGVITLVDAEQFPQTRARYPQLARSQVQVADLVILNKIDLVDAESLATLKSWVRETVPHARLIETTYGQVPLDLLLGNDGPARLGEETPLTPGLEVHVHPVEPAPDPHHHHDLAFAGWTYTSDQPHDLEAFRRACGNLPPSVIRAKGFLYLAGQARRAIVHVVGRRVQIDLDGEPWGDEPPTTHLVVLGDASGIDPEALTDLFEGCKSE